MTLLSFKIVFLLVTAVSKRNVKVLIGQRLHFVRVECIVDRRSTTSTPPFVSTPHPLCHPTTSTPPIHHMNLGLTTLVTFIFSCMVVSIITFFITLVFLSILRYHHHSFVTNVVDEVNGFCFPFSK